MDACHAIWSIASSMASCGWMSLRTRRSTGRAEASRAFLIISGLFRLFLVSGDGRQENYVHLAFDEIRMAGAGSPQVSRRLVAASIDLRRVVLPERIEVIDEQVELLRAATVEGAATVEAMDDERDVRFALDPDREGLGAAAP